MPRGIPNRKAEDEPRYGANLTPGLGVQMQDDELLAEMMGDEPDGGSEIAEPEVPASQFVFAEGWAAMDSAPLNGRMIYASWLVGTGIPMIDRLHWRVTRQLVRGAPIRWEEVGYWAREFSTQDFGIQPLAWHPDHFGVDPRL